MIYRKFIITFLLMSLTLLFFISISYASDYKYYQINDKQSVCEGAKDGEFRFKHFVGSYTEATPQYQRIFIPPHVTRFGITVPIKMGSSNVKVALRYGIPQGEYPSHYENYTHTIPPLYPVRSLDQARDENVIRVGSGGSETYALMNISNPEFLQGDTDGNWLYLNYFSQKERLIGLQYIYYIDTEPFMDWCDGGLSGPPADPRVTDGHTSTTSPITIEFSSQGVDKICYTAESTSSSEAGSVPDAPKDPEVPGDDDTCISGSSDSLEISAETGQYKIYKFNFRAKNEEGWSGVTSREYRLDLRPLDAQEVKVEPGSGEVEGNTIELQVSSENSTQIRYNIIETTSPTGEPYDPDPDKLGDFQSWAKALSGPSDILEIKTTHGVYKKVAVQFIGYNANNEEQHYGNVSEVYYYSLKATSVVPGPVVVTPGTGSFDKRENILVKSENSTRIFYQYSLVGEEPDDPKLSTKTIPGPEYSMPVPGKVGTNKLRIKFQGYNSDSKEWGPVSDVYSYTVTIPGNTPDPGPSPSPSPSPGPSDKEECERSGGTWIPIFNQCAIDTKNGSIRVDLGPANSGRWAIKGQQWRGSGESIEDLSPGTYNIVFKPSNGWFPPLPATVQINAGQKAEKGFDFMRIDSNLTLTEQQARAYPNIDISDALRNSAIDPTHRFLSDGTTTFNAFDLLYEHLQGLTGEWQGGEVWLQGNQKDIFVSFPGRKGIYSLRFTAVQTTDASSSGYINKLGEWVINRRGLNMVLESVCIDWMQDFLSKTPEFTELERLGSFMFPDHGDGKYFVVRCGDVRSSLDEEYFNVCVPSYSEKYNQTLTPYLREEETFADMLNDINVDFSFNEDYGYWNLEFGGNECCKAWPSYEFDSAHTSSTPDVQPGETDDEIVFITEKGAQKMWFECGPCQ